MGALKVKYWTCLEYLCSLFLFPIFIQVFSHEGHVNNKICSIFIPISDSMNIEHFETKNCSTVYGQLTNTFSESANN